MSSQPEKSAPQRTTIPHLPALDGLRGAAVIGVLLFHDGRLRGGYLGVDLFFVLSGFLITSLLLAEQRANARIDLKAFWIRRARRLLPAALALLPAAGLYAWLFAGPAEVARIRGDGIATLAYVANWRAIFAGKSYWDLFTAPSPLEHTWSLAIEEQFYVLWPLFAVLVLRRARGGARSLLSASALLAAASAAAMLLLYDAGDTSRAYMGTDTRGCAILVGAVLACALSGRAPLASAAAVRTLDVAGVLALLALAVAWAALDGKGWLLYHGGFWLTEAAALVLIACAAQGERSVVARALAFAPLRAAGLVSYGVYLWHWPIYVVLSPQRLGFAGLKLTALRLGATVALSLLSFHLLEQPIRRRGITFARPLLVVPAATAAALLCLLLGTRAAAVPQPAAEAAAARNYNDAIEALPAASELARGTLRVLVLGDSVAVALGDRLRYVQGRVNASVAVRAVGDCNVLDGKHLTRSLNNRRSDGGDCGAKWAADVAELTPDVTLVVLGGGFFAAVEIEGEWRAACDKAWHDAYVAELTRQARVLSGHSGRVVLATVPYPIYQWASEKWDSATDCLNALLVEVAAAVPGVKLLGMKERLCPRDNRSCLLMSRGEPIRPDGMHPVGIGGEEIAEWTLSALR